MNVLLVKQKDKLHRKYVRRFKTIKEIIESKLNKIYNDKDLELTQELNNKAWGEFVTYQFLKNTNPQKYGHVIKHLKDRKIIKKDEFPKTLTLEAH